MLGAFEMGGADMGKGGERHVLVVEDNPVDVEVICDALARLGDVKPWIVHDGEEAMSFLRQEAGPAQMPRPDLILLDLGLPRLDGRQILANMRESPELDGIPVVIITSSSHDADIAGALDRAADDYVIKPVEADNLVHTVRIWLDR